MYGSGDTPVARGDSVAELMARLEVAWGGVADETSLAMLCEPSETELSP